MLERVIILTRQSIISKIAKFNFSKTPDSESGTENSGLFQRQFVHFRMTVTLEWIELQTRFNIFYAQNSLGPYTINRATMII